MRHIQGDIICPYDCVLLKSGPRKTDLPFVAKVAAMWENPEDGKYIRIVFQDDMFFSSNCNIATITKC